MIGLDARLKGYRKGSASTRRLVKEYESGEFSFSNVERSNFEVTDQARPTSFQVDNEKCGICGKREEDGIVEELKITVNNGILNSNMCDSCNNLYH